MSKNLVKIITICLLAIIVPVAIVVTAICLSNAVTYKLTLDTAGFENAGSIVLKVNGQEYKAGEAFKVSRNKNVTLSVVSNGYTFDGWFEGKKEEIDETKQPVSAEGETTYTFKMTGDKVFTAKNSIIEYTVTYDGENETTHKYGEDLYGTDYAVISAEDAKAGYTFVGWTIADDETIYTKAEFGTETNIALVSKTEVVKENITYTVTYDGAHETEIKYGAALDNGTYAANIDKEAGDVFTGWVIDGEETVYTKAEFGTEVNVNLVSTKVNLYDDSYKSVSFSIRTEGEYTYQNEVVISPIVYELDNQITEQGTLTYDFYEMKFFEILNDLNLLTVYKDGTAYDIYSITIKINTTESTMINYQIDTMTIMEIIDEVEGFADGGTIQIRLAYLPA